MREFDYYRIVKENNGKWPYGVREWDGVLLFLVGFIFILVSSANAIGAKENKFYLWLILAILIPMGIYMNI
jgi:hypothetical protein